MTAILRGDIPCSTLSDYGAYAEPLPVSDEPNPYFLLTLATNAAQDGFVAIVVQKVGGLNQAATGGEAFTGTAAQRVSGLRQAAVGSEVFSGTATQRVSGLQQAAVGSEVFSGTVAQRVAGLRQAATGGEAFTGTATQRVSRLRQAAIGNFTFAGTIAQRLTGLRQAAVGGITFTGTIAQRLAGLRQAAAGSIVYSGTATQRVSGLRQTASGDITFEGTIAQRVSGLRQAASGDITFEGTIAQRVSGLRQAATGNVVTFIGTIAQHVSGLRQSASGSEVFLGTAAQHLGGLQQSATGTVTAGTTSSFYMPPMTGGGGIAPRWDDIGVAWELSLDAWNPEVAFNQFEQRILLEQNRVQNKENLRLVAETLSQKIDYEKVLTATLIGSAAYALWKVPAIAAPAVMLYIIAASVIRSGKEGVMTPERKVVFETLLTKMRDPITLQHMAKVFEKEGLIKEATMLNARANLRDIPKDVRDARYATFEKAMRSTNPNVVERIANAFESKFYLDTANKLRDHALNLRKGE